MEKNVKTYLACKDNKIIGALIMIYSPGTASYYLPCSIHEYRSYNPNTFLIASAIEDAKGRGIKIWNWESSPSKDSGVYKFKQKWGSIDSSYRIYIELHKEKNYFSDYGADSLAKDFPYFFVFPFNLIK